LKHLNKTGEDHVTFVDESLYLSYAKSTWWIDSGATIHVANSMQGLIMRRTLRRGERSIRVANGVEAEVEAIRELPLELSYGFILCLNNVLYVPSLSRNLISLCLILFNSKVVVLAFRQDKLYMLSMLENVNVVCNEKVSSSTNVSSKHKRCDAATSTKLCHYRLGHISRGRIERLIKDVILHLLDFLIQIIASIALKKYTKQVKRGEAKRSAGFL
jgi:hypothetical protein